MVLTNDWLKWFSVSEGDAEDLLMHEPGAAATTPSIVPTCIAIIAGNRFTQSIEAKGNAEITKDLRDRLWIEAGFPKPIGIPKPANSRSKLLANPETFGDGTYIVIAGSRKNPCTFVFKDGETVFSTCEDDVQHRVLSAYTTTDNDVDGEQLLAWQQELRAARAA